MLPVEGQMLPDLTSDMQTDYTQLGIKPASTMLIHWCSRKDLNQQWVYAKSELGFRWLWHFWSSRIPKGRFTILPNHGIKATGTCPLLVPAWSDQVAKSTYVHDFPRTLSCWRTVTKSSQAELLLVSGKDWSLPLPTLSRAVGDRCCPTGRTSAPAYEQAARIAWHAQCNIYEHDTTLMLIGRK